MVCFEERNLRYGLGRQCRNPGTNRGHARVPGNRKRMAGGLLPILLVAVVLCISACGAETEPVRVAFYYENVCASCEGDADFYALYNKCISQEEKERLNVEISTYNVFMDSCRELYGEEAERLGIPQETSLPVLIIGDQWFEGYERMEEALRRILVEERAEK